MRYEEDFDHEYMRKLSQTGYDMALKGYRPGWNVPPEVVTANPDRECWKWKYPVQPPRKPA